MEFQWKMAITSKHGAYIMYTLHIHVYTRIYIWIPNNMEIPSKRDSEQLGNTLKINIKQLGNTLKSRYANQL